MKRNSSGEIPVIATIIASIQRRAAPTNDVCKSWTYSLKKSPSLGSKSSEAHQYSVMIRVEAITLVL